MGDTSYIEANDVPFYSCHATGDQTVQYGFGAPLNGFSPVELYGSGNLETRFIKYKLGESYKYYEKMELVYMQKEWWL